MIFSLFTPLEDDQYQSAESNVPVLFPSLPKYSQRKNFCLNRLILRLIFRFILLLVLLSWFSDVIVLFTLL